MRKVPDVSTIKLGAKDVGKVIYGVRFTNRSEPPAEPEPFIVEKAARLWAVLRSTTSGWTREYHLEKGRTREDVKHGIHREVYSFFASLDAIEEEKQAWELRQKLSGELISPYGFGVKLSLSQLESIEAIVSSKA